MVGWRGYSGGGKGKHATSRLHLCNIKYRHVGTKTPEFRPGMAVFYWQNCSQQHQTIPQRMEEEDMGRVPIIEKSEDRRFIG